MSNPFAMGFVELVDNYVKEADAKSAMHMLIVNANARQRDALDKIEDLSQKQDSAAKLIVNLQKQKEQLAQQKENAIKNLLQYIPRKTLEKIALEGLRGQP